MVSHTTGDRDSPSPSSSDSVIDDGVPAVGECSANSLPSGGSVVLRRRWLVAAVIVLCLLIVGAVFLRLGNEAEPSTPLGGSAAIDGGVLRINGVIPLEADGWMPAERAPELSGAIQTGTHRVRVLVELTALEPQGVEFAAADYSIEGLGVTIPAVQWSSPVRLAVAQGETIRATLVFEIPDKAIALVLVLEDSQSTRLSLGVDHHIGR